MTPTATSMIIEIPWGSVFAIAGSVLVPLVAQTLAGAMWAIRLDTQVKSLTATVERMDKTLNAEGFANCQLHAQRISQLENRICTLEDRIG